MPERWFKARGFLCVGWSGRVIKSGLAKSRQPGLAEQIGYLCGAITTLTNFSKRVMFVPLQTYYEQALEIASSDLDEPTFEQIFARARQCQLKQP